MTQNWGLDKALEMREHVFQELLGTIQEVCMHFSSYCIHC